MNLNIRAQDLSRVPKGFVGPGGFGAGLCFVRGLYTVVIPEGFEDLGLGCRMKGEAPRVK